MLVLVSVRSEPFMVNLGRHPAVRPSTNLGGWGEFGSILRNASYAARHMEKWSKGNHWVTTGWWSLDWGDCGSQLISVVVSIFSGVSCKFVFYLWRVWFYIGCLFRFLLHACAIELVEIMPKNCEPPTLSSILNLEEHVIRFYCGGIFDKSIKMSLKFLLDQGEDYKQNLLEERHAWLWHFVTFFPTSKGKRWRTRGATCCGAPSSSRRFVSCLKIHEGQSDVNLSNPTSWPWAMPLYFLGGWMERLASYSFVGNYFIRQL